MLWPARSPLLRSPRRWQVAVSQIPSSKILPLELGGSRDQAYAAWLGDKFLGAALAEALRSARAEHDRGSATELTAIASSNRFMAANAGVILPEYGDEARVLSERGVGTMVEAAVAEVHADDAAAVDDLAAWLVEKAVATPDPNAKGRLLQLGGSVDAIREGGSDHLATFRAVAKLGGSRAEAEGSSKKQAEQLAASLLLEDIDEELANGNFLAERETVVFERPLDEWEHFSLSNYALELKDGETTKEWWFRGAGIPKESFRRAMLAPMVFPEHIIAVDSWTRKTVNNTCNESSAVFIVITARDEEKNMVYESTPVFEAASSTKARMMLGIEANKLISNIASVDLPAEG